ncbi:MAG TPA: alpha/beta hydrolase [Candidatus Angelobacter sp.]|nr:alpha/beta hydrolase [Candidatus Angelobacter sp.]
MLLSPDPRRRDVIQLFVISGLGCYPLPPPDHDEPFNQLRYGLSQRGFVTMWVEKNGEGASQGPACDSEQSDLQFAVSRSIAGLKALATYDFVDRDNIFIFAHSIGPLEGVAVAEKFPVRALIASETIGKSWYEYQLENTRHQLLLVGRPYDVVEKAARTVARCQYHFLIEKQTPERVVKDAPDCRDSVRTFGVSASYLQQIADLDLAAEWKKIDVPVLVTWGTSDALTSAEESRYLTDMINSFHPQFKDMGHGLNLWPSQKEFLESNAEKQDAPFDTDFLQRVAGWLKQNLGKSAALRR